MGDRWDKVAHAGEQTLDQHLVVFTGPHQVMALDRTGRKQALTQALQGFNDDELEQVLACVQCGPMPSLGAVR